MILFENEFVPPPGGEYFYQLGEDSFRTRSYNEAVRLVRAIMAKHGVTGYAPEELAKHMCPHMPDGFCTKSYGNKLFSLEKQKQDAEVYFSMPLAAYDEVEKRISTCIGCPKHSRSFCLSCIGAYDWIRAKFRGARRMLPADKYTGTCTCAGTFAAVVASVDKKYLPEWDDVPDTCWRKQ